MTLHKISPDADASGRYDPLFADIGETNEVPKHPIPSGEMNPRVAYQLIHDELLLHGNARQKALGKDGVFGSVRAAVDALPATPVAPRK